MDWYAHEEFVKTPFTVDVSTTTHAEIRDVSRHLPEHTRLQVPANPSTCSWRLHQILFYHSARLFLMALVHRTVVPVSLFSRSPAIKTLQHAL